MQHSPARNAALVFGLFLLSIVFSLCVSELFLRLIGFSYELYPGEVQFGWPDPAYLHERYRLDRDLFWVPKGYDEIIGEARRSHPRLIFLGCSCTEFGQYDRDLAALLSTDRNTSNVSFANFGVGGWSSYQGLQQLKRDIVNLGPSVITVYFGWNDHWIGFGIQDRDVASLNSSFSFLLAKFRVVQLLNKAYVAILRRRTDHVAERVTPDEFRSNLQEIVRIARSHGITPVLLTAPSSFEKGHEPVFLRERWLRDLDSLIPLHQQYVSIVRNVAHELGVPLCDLAREFDALPKEEVRERLFRKDGIHPTPDGDRMIAQFLFNCLKENGLLEKIGR